MRRARAIREIAFRLIEIKGGAGARPHTRPVEMMREPRMLVKFLSAGLIASAAFAAAAAAQPIESGQHEVVVVTAPSVVFHEAKAPAGSRATGGGMLRPIEVVSVNRSVSYADLDLAKDADAATLGKRINDAAADACRALDKRYPKKIYIPVSPNEDCAANAAGNAMKIANQVIAAAKQK